jgi:cyclopropane-fatty-acyl-phospholipid synthase
MALEPSITPQLATLPENFSTTGAFGRVGDLTLGRLARAALVEALGRWKIGDLTVRLPDGQIVRAGTAGNALRATLWITRDAFFRKLAIKGPQWIGESYMDGDWRTDDLPRFLEIGMRNHAVLPEESPLTWLSNGVSRALHRGEPNTRRGSRKNIQRHYDLSNALFRLFLDESMTYSSGIYEHEGESLSSAQQRKYRAFGEKLSLGPDDRVLEIGCGWGGFALFAAREYGCRVTGITLSDQQLELARDRVKKAGLADRIALHLCDYRDVVTLLPAGETFTKIVSIEMLEAVGQAQWEPFFRVCDSVLGPGGVVGIQTIAVPDENFREHASQAQWVQKYIFPGGLLPSLGELCKSMARGSRLAVRHVVDIGPHYAPTLAEWRERFLRQLSQVRALGFDERFVRMWEFYLAGSEAGFRTGRLQNLQLVLGRGADWAASAAV